MAIIQPVSGANGDLMSADGHAKMHRVLAIDASAPDESLVADSSGDIGINNATPDASAKVDIVSTTKGMLIPRMTTTQKNAISTPATGLLVFDTTLNAYSYYNGSAWTAIGGGGGLAPASIVSTDFEASARFSTINGAPTYASSGLDLYLLPGNTVGITWLLAAGANSGIWDGNPQFTIELNPYSFGNSGTATDAEVYVGLGDLGLAVGGHTKTTRHCGFFITKNSGSNMQLIASQAAGTPRATSVLTSNLGGLGKNLSLCLVIGASSITYYWKLGTGAWSSATTISTNMPSGTTSGYAQFSVTNPSGSILTQDIRILGATYIR